MQRRERSAESAFNGCVFDAFWVEWSFTFCTFQVRNIFSRKFACCLSKQNPYARYFRSCARPLKICEVCNFGTITGSLCERFVVCIQNSVLSTLPDNPGHSWFWTISVGLQIRVCNLPDNCRSLQFLVDSTFCQSNFKYFALFELFTPSNVSSETLVCLCNISNNVIGGKQTNQVQMLQFHCFFAQMASCFVHYDVIYYAFPVNCQYLKKWGVDSPGDWSLVSFDLELFLWQGFANNN